MKVRSILTVVAVLSLSGLAGCYGSPNATVHEPGVYKGKLDPLLQKERSTDQQAVLRKRFFLVQTDR